MAKEITDIDVLQTYPKGVMRRGKHHAQTVDEIVLALIGAVIWRKNSNPITVKQYAGRPANVLWWHSRKGNKYAFRYEHSNGTVELRKDTYTGQLIASFDNQTTIAAIKTAFEAL